MTESTERGGVGRLRLLTGHDHSTKIMTAVVGLALLGVLVAAIAFVTVAMSNPRPVL